MMDTARSTEPIRHTVARRTSSSLPVRIEPKRYGLTWDETVDIVGSNNLARFHRQPSTEAAYRVHLGQVRAVYGTVQDYVLDELLHWGPEDLNPAGASTSRRPADVIQWDRCPHSDASGCKNEVFFQGSTAQCKALATPFPYAIPNNARHMIVWCKQPILHPCAIDSSEFDPWIRQLAWEHIQSNGLTGVELGAASKDTGRYLGGLPADLMAACSIQAGAQDAVRRAIFTAGRHIREYVQLHYGQQHDAVWFANPPSLQSIPDLAHFHCMLSPKDAREVPLRHN